MTNRIFLCTALCAAAALTGANARAQQLELPRPSPNAKVSQIVGLTDVTVEYSSPAVNKRKIWGGLLPYGTLWRTGANAATKITFNKDVTVADKPVPAGSYSIFTIPAKDNNWTVILNKNATASTDEYKQDQDIVRFQSKAQPAPHRERLLFLFNNTTESATSLDLEWEKVRVSIPIRAKTDEQVAANIKNVTEGAWRPWNTAARYMMESKKDYDTGLKYVDQSLALREEWFNVWTKAQLYAAKGRYKDAYPLAQKAQQLGEKNPNGFFFADEVKKALADWKNK